MNKIGLFYSFEAHKSSKVAEKIAAHFDADTLDKLDAAKVTEELFGAYTKMILGVPTWFDGELPSYWDEFVPALEDMNLEGKKIALYGLGDQVKYPENFLDAIGIMAELLLSRGAEIVGYTSAEGYSFERSKAYAQGKFCGLGIDYENQHEQTNQRIADWAALLKIQFGA